MAQKKKSADRPEGLSASLEESLIESLPGLVVLDRDLDYGGQVGIDLVAADQAGALTLVLLVDGEGEEPVLAALDVLAFARREQLLLERHLGQASFRGDLPPRVILVADRFDQLLRERIAPLGDVRVELFELRELKSAAATRSYLVPRGDGAIEGAGDQSLAAFLDSLSEERRPLAASELAALDGIALDPPRAGAAAQIREIAASAVPVVAYASCNPSTFARDARTLVDGGYRLETVTPIDQFLWSAEVELAGVFRR